MSINKTSNFLYRYAYVAFIAYTFYIMLLGTMVPDALFEARSASDYLKLLVNEQGFVFASLLAIFPVVLVVAITVRKLLESISKKVEVFIGLESVHVAPNRNIMSELDELKNILENIGLDPSTSKKSKLEKEDLEKIAKDLIEVDIKHSVDRLIDDTIKEKVKSSNKEERYNQVVDSLWELILAKLDQARKTTSSRGAFNLIVGGVIASIGVWLLYDLIQQVDYSNADTNTTAVILNLVSRLSTVIVIQVFAFFFLSLYKTGLVETRQIQNEITNVLTWRTAFEAGQHMNMPEKQFILIEKLMNVERNFVLKKGESTVSLEQQRLGAARNQTSFTEMIRLLKDIKGQKQ